MPRRWWQATRSSWCARPLSARLRQQRTAASPPGRQSATRATRRARHPVVVSCEASDVHGSARAAGVHEAEHALHRLCKLDELSAGCISLYRHTLRFLKLILFCAQSRCWSALRTGSYRGSRGFSGGARARSDGAARSAGARARSALRAGRAACTAVCPAQTAHVYHGDMCSRHCDAVLCA